MSFNTDGSHASMSFNSDGSHASQECIPMDKYLTARDDEQFIWEETGRENAEAWIKPVRDAGLDARKHKVFYHAGKEYLSPPEPFQSQGALGESGSTTVYKVTCPEEKRLSVNGYKRPLALKIIYCKEDKRPPGPDSGVRKKALQEVRNMAAVRHPHIVVYVASFEDCCIRNYKAAKSVKQNKSKATATHMDQRISRHILGIAMYPPGLYNLRSFMDEITMYPQDDGWEIAYMHNYFGCLAQAVAYLHTSRVQIRHKDIKPENIVIDEFGCAILTDFGLSRHFEADQHSEGTTAKTPRYADPEATRETKRDVRSDVFSLGCVYLEMATVLLGKPLYFAEEQLRSPDDVGEFHYADCLDRLPGYTKKLGQIAANELVATYPAREASAEAIIGVLPHIERMMHKDFNQRPYANELYPLFRHLAGIHKKPGLCETCENEWLTGQPFPTTRRSPRSTRAGSQSGHSPTLPRRSSTVSTIPASPRSDVTRRNTVLSSQISHSPTDMENGMDVDINSVVRRNTLLNAQIGQTRLPEDEEMNGT
ncbi:kinase-like domain-containing protein [Diplogelasinospora grovesii]|uniref:non-specific serine/threonine protein kinase n=1 Tax=Diplogelasinospora grovesii TaxID=303347 RepID=A0AAN6NAD7_9PEZI|nr:kinase-like domain-containing protein [Diplogelasinospora grovesii]